MFDPCYYLLNINKYWTFNLAAAEVEKKGRPHVGKLLKVGMQHFLGGLFITSLSKNDTMKTLKASFWDQLGVK